MRFSLKVLERGMKAGNVGHCVACGAKAHGVEPDARRYVCEACGKPKVYGDEELVFMGCVK